MQTHQREVLTSAYWIASVLSGRSTTSNLPPFGVSKRSYEGVLYPALAPGTSGLAKTSCALTDHVRSIDKRRIRRIFGQLSADELARIDQGLELFLGLNQGRLPR